MDKYTTGSNAQDKRVEPLTGPSEPINAGHESISSPTGFPAMSPLSTSELDLFPNIFQETSRLSTPELARATPETLNHSISLSSIDNTNKSGNFVVSSPDIDIQDALDIINKVSNKSLEETDYSTLENSTEKSQPEDSTEKCVMENSTQQSSPENSAEQNSSVNSAENKLEASTDNSPVNSPEKTSSDDSAEEDKTHKKPNLSYLEMISEAILSSSEKKLVLNDIYDYLSDKYPFYKTSSPTWKNSIRHNLSIDECFVKKDRARNGRGYYWAIHDACFEDFKSGIFSRRQARLKVEARKKLLITHSMQERQHYYGQFSPYMGQFTPGSMPYSSTPVATPRYHPYNRHPSNMNYTPDYTPYQYSPPDSNPNAHYNSWGSSYHMPGQSHGYHNCALHGSQHNFSGHQSYPYNMNYGSYPNSRQIGFELEKYRSNHNTSTSLESQNSSVGAQFGTSRAAPTSSSFSSEGSFNMGQNASAGSFNQYTGHRHSGSFNQSNTNTSGNYNSTHGHYNQLSIRLCPSATPSSCPSVSSAPRSNTPNAVVTYTGPSLPSAPSAQVPVASANTRADGREVYSDNNNHQASTSSTHPYQYPALGSL